MSTAVLVRIPDFERIIPWAVAIARARRDDLELLIPCEKDHDLVIEDLHAPDAPTPGGSDLIAFLSRLRDRFPAAPPSDAADGDATAPEEGAPRSPDISVVGLPEYEIARAALDRLESHRPGLLVLPPPLVAEGPVREVFRAVSCRTLILDPAPRVPEGPPRILVPTASGANARLALRLALDLAGPEGRVEALYVEPRIGGEAEFVGRKILEREIGRAIAGRSGTVHRRVRIADDPAEGIIATVRDGRFDLVLLGATEGLPLPRLRRGTIPERVRRELADCAVGVVRREIPLAYRLERGLIRLLRGIVPQLSREERVELVTKVQSSSSFNFDFVTLISLSTLIAALGLMRDSAAVVIGAMLVAPLMTPLVGCGLALVHGNLVLIRNATRAVLWGFVVSFAIGLVLGTTVPGVIETEEMLARGAPNVLDLVVAAASGLAAAYATARPGLSGALPGVAIAAALVPPIATTGIAVSVGQWRLAAGAALLFFTNIVAIVIGASISLYAVGLRGDRPPERRTLWIRPTVATLLVIALLLAVGLSYALYDSLPAARISGELRDAIAARLGRISGTLDRVRSDPWPREGEPPGVDLHIWSRLPAMPDAAFVEELATLASGEMGRPVRVRLHTDLVIEGESRGP